MFNESLKQEFINGYAPSGYKNIKCIEIFNLIERYEIEKNADICTMNEDEAKVVLDSLSTLRKNSAIIRMTIINDYCKWCLDVKKYPGAKDGLLTAQPSNINKIKSQTVSSPEHLQAYLNTICNPEDDKCTDNIYRCYYWLAYGGMEEDDILSVKVTDVDFNNMIVKYNDTIVYIYREAVPAFKNCVELKEFVYDHPNYKINKVRVPGDTLIRGIRSDLTLNSIRVELSRRAKKYADSSNIRLSYKRAWISGLFYRTLTEERMGEKVNFLDVVIQKTQDKDYKLNGGINAKLSKQKSMAKQYESDYELWKAAYK